VLWASIVHCATFDAIHWSTHKNIMITKKKKFIVTKTLEKSHNVLNYMIEEYDITMGSNYGEMIFFLVVTI
jgi:hypothetical protein